MSVVGTLAVKITGDTTDLEQKLNTSKSKLRQFGETAAKFAIPIAKGMAVAGTAVAGLTLQYTRNAKEISNLARLSSVGVEEFQKLAFAAQTVGISQQKLSDVFKDVQDRVGDFISTGAGPMADFFENIAPKVGVTVEQFRSLSGSDALGLFYQSLEKANLSQAEMIFYMEQMASDSSLLIPLLKSNSAEFKNLGDQVAATGGIMSKQGVEAAIEFSKNLDQIKSIGAGLFYDIANSWMPLLADLSNSFLEAQRASGSLFTALAATVLTDLPQTFDEATEAIIKQEIKVRELEEAYKRVELGTSTMSDRFKISSQDLELEKSRLAILEKQALLLQQNRERLTNVVGVPSFTPPPPFQPPAPTPEVTTFVEEMNQEVDAYAQFIEQITGRADRARQAQEEGWLALARSIGDISSEEYEKAIEQIRGVEEEMSQFAISAARNIQSVLGDGIYNFLSGKFDDIGQSFLNMLNRMVADLLSSQISQLLFGNFGSSNQIGGIVGQIAGAIGSAIGGGLSGQVASGANALTVNQGMGYGGFAYGGYTGDGNKYEPAGVVHKGEYVLNSAATKRIGIANLDRMNKGYANGGYVGNAPMGGVNINIRNEAGADGYRATAQARQNSDGGLNIDVLVRRIVASDISNNGALAQQMANTFGLRRAI